MATADLSNTAGVTRTPPTRTRPTTPPPRRPTVDPSADLSITKSDAADPVIAGTDLTYTIDRDQRRSLRRHGRGRDRRRARRHELRVRRRRRHRGRRHRDLEPGRPRRRRLGDPARHGARRRGPHRRPHQHRERRERRPPIPTRANDTDTETTAVDAQADLSIGRRPTDADPVTGRHRPDLHPRPSPTTGPPTPRTWSPPTCSRPAWTSSRPRRPRGPAVRPAAP